MKRGSRPAITDQHHNIIIMVNYQCKSPREAMINVRWGRRSSDKTDASQLLLGVGRKPFASSSDRSADKQIEWKVMRKSDA